MKRHRLEWVGSECGVRADIEHDPEYDDEPQPGDRDPCTMCPTPPRRRCWAVVRVKVEPDPG